MRSFNIKCIQALFRIVVKEICGVKKIREKFFIVIKNVIAPVISFAKMELQLILHESLGHFWSYIYVVDIF